MFEREIFINNPDILTLLEDIFILSLKDALEITVNSGRVEQVLLNKVLGIANENSIPKKHSKGLVRKIIDEIYLFIIQKNKQFLTIILSYADDFKNPTLNLEVIYSLIFREEKVKSFFYSFEPPLGEELFKLYEIITVDAENQEQFQFSGAAIKSLISIYQEDNEYQVIQNS
ncbi:hypothetical protein [Flectobacillus sp. BAB-3569]|uniref:hypothetical protein n=1 Tax=Flectobacillus sp. BAB-3569 TaxID=1509483 RepID=UPI001140265E|nr:hypothetical protein [Flectobacillus sp. BAB-3569]